jgi:hypothetical protein
MQGREYSVNEARPIQLGYEGFTETAPELSSDMASFFLSWRDSVEGHDLLKYIEILDYYKWPIRRCCRYDCHGTP